MSTQVGKQIVVTRLWHRAGRFLALLAETLARRRPLGANPHRSKLPEEVRNIRILFALACIAGEFAMKIQAWRH